MRQMASVFIAAKHVESRTGRPAWKGLFFKLPNLSISRSKAWEYLSISALAALTRHLHNMPSLYVMYAYMYVHQTASLTLVSKIFLHRSLSGFVSGDPRMP